MPRIGKISRLPRPLRSELNRRLDTGEKGSAIVRWLNAHEDTQRILNIAHGGRPVTEQNLSEWRNGAFQDWKRNRDVCEWVAQVAGTAGEVADEAGLMPLTDSLTSMAALTIGRRLQELGTDALSDDDKRAEFFVLLKELNRLRQDDLKAATARIEIESFERRVGRFPS